MHHRPLPAARPFHVPIAAAIASAALAQTPRFAEVGEPLPDGMGQLGAAADYDGDGDVDLFTATGVVLANGGFFRAGPTLALGPLQNVRSLAVADLTGDGSYAGGVTGAQGRSDVLLPIPAGPAFAGLGFSWQALIENRLTNGFDTWVLP